MPKKVICVDGLLVPASQHYIHQLSPGTVKGKGVFETLRAYRGRLFAMEAHWRRLFRGLKVLGIRPPVNRRKLTAFCEQTLESNRLKNARLRVTVWHRHRKTRVAIAAAAYTPYPAAKYREGFRALISDIRRDERAAETRIKSIRYLPFLEALRRARRGGNDEAILLNRQGDLVEGSRTNLFIVKDRVVYTPSRASGCLEGVTRQAVIRLARGLKIPCRQKRLRPEDLLAADEAFLTNSLIEIMPLTHVQGQVIGGGRPGPLTQKLTRHYRKLVRDSLGR